MPKVNQIAVKNPQTGEYEIADISSSASNITFDGGNLSLDAEDVQGAIEEVKELIDENTSDIGTLTTTVSTKSTVRVVPALDSGAEVGTVTVDGTDTVLYAPTPIVPVDVEGNPEDPAEETLTKILIDDVVYGLPNDQGSVVTVDTIQQSGTNIVDIDVDNVTYHIYAPTPPTVIPNDSAPSQTTTPLTNITINGDTYTTNQVSANPQGTGTDLETISIDGTIYSIPQGSSTVADLEDLDNVTIISPTEGQVLKYDNTNQVWINANESGGSGGHTILDNSGTALTQRDDLQFIGAYVNDDSTNEITKVNVVREMTKAQFDLLSNAEKVGLIRVTDEDDGIGSGYRETLLWSGSETPTVGSPYTATLSDSIENYDAIAILCKNTQGDEYYNLPIFLTSEFIIDRHFEGSYLSYSPAYDLWRLSNTTISLGLYSSQSSVIYEKVIGINFGGSSSSPLSYSTNEQKTGQKWIDGKDIYQKTVTFTGSNINKGERGYVNVVGLPNNIERYISAEVNTYDDGAPSIFGGIVVISVDSVNNRALLYNSFITEKIIFTQNSYITIQYTKTT